MGNYEQRDKKRNQKASERDESRFYNEKTAKKPRKKVQEDRRELDDFSRSLEKVFANED